MKTKQQSKRSAEPKGTARKVAGTVTAQGVSPGSPVVTTEYANPPVELLLREAEKEPVRIQLEEYAEVIQKLRFEKGLTFREIAEWLAKRGVQTNHNAVFRLISRRADAFNKRQEVDQESE